MTSVDITETKESQSTTLAAKAFGARGASSPLEALTIQRRALRPNDVQIEIAYCGVCHSDLHQVRNEWSGFCRPLIRAFLATKSSGAS